MVNVTGPWWVTGGRNFNHSHAWVCISVQISRCLFLHVFYRINFLFIWHVKFIVLIAARLYLYTVNVQCPWRPEGIIRSPITGVVSCHAGARIESGRATSPNPQCNSSIIQCLFWAPREMMASKMGIKRSDCQSFIPIGVWNSEHSQDWKHSTPFYGAGNKGLSLRQNSFQITNAQGKGAFLALTGKC